MAGDLGSDELLREWQSGGSALGADAIGALVSLLKNASSEIRRGEVRAASPPGHGRFDCAHRGGPARDEPPARDRPLGEGLEVGAVGWSRHHGSPRENSG